MHAFTTVENTLIFFPMIRETEVICPQKSNFSKIHAQNTAQSTQGG